MTVETSVLVLDYATEPPGRGRRWEILFAVLSLPALATPFLIFAYGTSPLEAAEDLFQVFRSWVGPLPLLGASFFVAFPVLLWKIRRLVGTPRRWEMRSMTAVLAASWLPHVVVMGWFLYQIIKESNWPAADWRQIAMEWSMPLAAFGVPASAVLLASRLRQREPARALEVLMMSPFLANAIVCLLGFFDDPRPGYWLTLAVCIVWLGEMALLGWPAMARRLRFFATGSPRGRRFA